jgi:putative DNA primase/helicase
LATIKFNQRFPRDDPHTDKTLLSKLAGESSGILNWAIQGCLEYQREGLRKPAAVKNATAEYRQQMDVLAQFLDHCCHTGQDLHAGATALYQRFLRFGGQGSQTDFGLALGERGFLRERATSGPLKGNIIWRGIGLADEGSEQ